MKGSEVLEKNNNKSVIQRLIDNRINSNEVQDIRLPVIGNNIPFAYLKARPISNRFSNMNTRATITNTQNTLSQQEIIKILEFCRETNTDYAELDVLRDINTNDIWIVDINNTPAGPPNGLSHSEMNFAIREMAISFYNQFISPGHYFKNNI